MFLEHSGLESQMSSLNNFCASANPWGGVQSRWLERHINSLRFRTAGSFHWRHSTCLGEHTCQRSWFFLGQSRFLDPRPGILILSQEYRVCFGLKTAVGYTKMAAAFCQEYCFPLCSVERAANLLLSSVLQGLEAPSPLNTAGRDQPLPTLCPWRNMWPLPFRLMMAQILLPVWEKAMWVRKTCHAD